jgi:excisionase family DNA binding protein
MTNNVYTVSELCAKARISRSLFYKLLANGKGPPLVRFGRRVVIREEDAAAWLAASRT